MPHGGMTLQKYNPQTGQWTEAHSMSPEFDKAVKTNLTAEQTATVGDVSQGTTSSGGHSDMVSGAGAVTQRSKLTTKFLKYPTTVGQMQDGHYIIFEVHDITKPKLTKGPTVDKLPDLNHCNLCLSINSWPRCRGRQ